MNERFINIFTDMAMYEESLKRTFPARAYWNAVKIFKSLDFEVDDAEQIKDLKGIGKGIYEKVDSYLKVGTFPKYKEFLNSEIAQCKEIASIKGFGMNKAKKLFDGGIRSLEELKVVTKNMQVGDELVEGMNFTNAMKIGLNYEAHTDKTRMTVEQHDAVAQPLLKAIINEIPNVIECEAVGSRRRFNGSVNYTIGDIDIIINVNNDTLKI